MKKTLLFLLTGLLFQSIYAIQAYPVRKTVQTTGGKTISVVLCGDEHHSFYRNDDGTMYKELPSGLFREYSDAEQKAIDNVTGARRSEAASRQLSARTTRSGITGVQKGLVILAEFADVKFMVGNNEIFQDFFNKPNYTDYNMTGSVHDYFYDQSYGQFDLTFDIVGPVVLPQTMAYYGEHVDDVNDKNAKQFAVDAIKAAAPSVDFSKYDWDNDGYVDQVFIVYAGYNEAEGGPKESIWPHEWTINEYDLSFNGVKFATYGCSSELRGFWGKNLCGIGTACHEFSHCLGIPDTYDTNKSRNFGMGDWDLMSSGNYLDNSCSPIGYTAYERWLCGWLQPTEIDKECSVTGMKALEDEPEAYVLHNDGFRNEYYILENRQPKKWGSSINAHGLLVVHVDFDGSVWYQNRVNVEMGRERMTFIPADGLKHADNYNGDPFPGTSKNTELTDTSDPAAIVYNKNADGTFLMGKPITNIAETEDGLISFDAMRGVIAAPENIEAAVLSAESFSLTWKSVDAVEYYEVEITQIPGLKDNPFESYLLEEDFVTTCFAATVNTSNKITGSLDNYTASKGWICKNVYFGPKGLQLGINGEKGTLRTPNIQSYYGLFTPVITISPAKANSTVKYNVNIYVDGVFWGGWNNVSTSSENSIILRGLPELKSKISLEIETADQLNVQNISIHEGSYLVDDFVKYSESGAHSFVEKITSETKTTDTNSYIFDTAKSGYLYKCKVRAILGAEGQTSKWSSEVLIDLNSTGLEDIKDNVIGEENWYDIQGRKVDINKPGIIINNKRILMVR